MYTYSLGLMVGKKIQHALKVQAENIQEAIESWAFNKRVLHSGNWNHEKKTYKGYTLICFETNDPRVDVKFKVKGKHRKEQEKKAAIPKPAETPKEQEYQGQSLMPDDEAAMSVNLTPPSDVPNFKFQKTWVADEKEKKKTHVGFDDDKPI